MNIQNEIWLDVETCGYWNEHGRAYANEVSGCIDKPAGLAEDARALVQATEFNFWNNIELLQERRTALISAAVTGKIDVREFASVGAR